MVRYQGAFRSHMEIMSILRPPAGPSGQASELNVWNLPSLGAIHLANYLRGEGLAATVINNLDAEWYRFCAAYRASAKPPLIGISTTFHLSFAEVKRIVRRVRAFAPDARVVLGGALVYSRAPVDGCGQFETMMRRNEIDYVLHAVNPETDLRDLLHAARDGADPAAVANLVYLDRSRPARGFHETPAVWHAPLLNQQPSLWHELDLPFVRKTFPMRTSAGCPFCCAFCSYPALAHGFHTMDVECFERSLASVLRIPAVKRIVFIDDTFNTPPARFRQLCRVLLRHPIEWYSFLRASLLDEETAQLMRDSGCRAVYLGLESANDGVLKNMNKHATRQQFAAGVALLRKYGIASIAAFVLGFPGENDQSIEDNRSFIESSGVEFYTLKEFYYAREAPVHETRERWKLTGDGSKWTHATMDSRRAYEKKMELFNSITSSCFVDPDSSLWHVVALQDAGFDLKTIDTCQRAINAAIREQFAGRFDDNSPAFADLRRALAAAA